MSPRRCWDIAAGREPAARPMVRLLMPDMPSPPAAFVVSRVMRPGHEDDHVGWITRVFASARASDGFVSAVRLDQAGGLHHLVVLFDDPASSARWAQGAAYRALAGEADRVSVGLDQSGCGAVMGFDLPSEVAASKWKTALVTWLGVVPTLLILSGAIARALPDVPRVVQQILSSILLTAALTWLILPKVRGWSRFWMMRNGRGNLRKDPG